MCAIFFDVTLQDYLKEIDSAPLLSAQQERQLGMRVIIDNDPVARDLLVRSNLRLVVNMAKKYGNRGMSLGDLIEEGNLGLIRAVDYYDPRRGNRFSTYAAWWIKQSIKRALLMNVQPVHVPTYMVALINQWRHTITEMEHKLGREPHLDEMAEIMQLPPQKAKVIIQIIKSLTFIREAAVAVDDSAEESPIEEDSMLDIEAGKPEDAMVENEEKAKALSLLDKVGDREAEILRLHYGLGGQKPLSLKEISEKLHLTRERIRQLQRQALTQLYGFMNE